MAVAVDFHTEDPGQLKRDLEKLARSVRSLEEQMSSREPRWTPTPPRFESTSVAFGEGARFMGVVATAMLPLASASQKGRSLAIIAPTGAAITLAAQGDQLINDAATYVLNGPGFWVVWFDGENFGVTS